MRDEKHYFNHLQVIGRFTLPLSHSFSRGIELTESPMSKCVDIFSKVSGISEPGKGPSSALAPSSKARSP